MIRAIDRATDLGSIPHLISDLFFAQFRFNVIAECNEEQGVDGDDAIFCEGKCNSWIHRMCVGLSLKAYQELSDDDSPYLCPHCKITQQADEIEELKKVVSSLTTNLNSIKEELLKAKNNTTRQKQSHSTVGTTVEPRLSELIGGKGCLDNRKYVKSNIHTFIYRALLNYSNKAFTC